MYAKGKKGSGKNAAKNSTKTMYRIARSIVARNVESKQYYTDLAGSFNLEHDTCRG